jgi:hypothetical protein
VSKIEIFADLMAIGEFAKHTRFFYKALRPYDEMGLLKYLHVDFVILLS